MGHSTDQVAVNLQPPSPRVRGGSGDVEVHSTFYTMQGEGPHAGRPAVFVRLAGCNLQCPMCDTDYTSENRLWPPDALAARLQRMYTAPGTPLIVITGGEPFRQYLTPLVGFLQKNRCQVQIETNGTLPLSPDAGMFGVNWPLVDIVCSPKTGNVNRMLKRFVTAYKYIVNAGDVSEEDGLPLHALAHPASPKLARPRRNFPLERVYVQPEDPDPDGAHLQACLRSVQEHGYTLSLQQHKIVGLP